MPPKTHIHIDYDQFARMGSHIIASGPKEKCCKWLSVGMRVRIIEGPCDLDGNHSYHGKYIGRTGEIVRIPDIPLTDEPELPVITVGVLIDGSYNVRSQYGCFWFKPEELIEINEKENSEMLLLKNYKVAEIEVNGYGTQYVAHYEEDLGDGDHVVVSNGTTYICGEVVNAFADNSHIRPKMQLVTRIDDHAYLDRCERAQKAKELENKLNTAVADYQKIALYEMLAEKSPAIAELLKELKEVTDV